MNLNQRLQATLTRAHYCKLRKKNTSGHHREAALIGGLILARENRQKLGKRYARKITNALRVQ